MRIRALVALAAAAVLGGACAHSEPPTEEPAVSTAPAAHGGLAECLHAHGIPDTATPAVLGPPEGVDPAVWQEAMHACSTLAPGPAQP